MRRAAMAAAILAAAMAAAASPSIDQDGHPVGDRPVLIAISAGPRIDMPLPRPPPGAEIPLARIAAILYLDVPCRIPVVNREAYHLYANAAGLGCWAETVGGGYRLIDERGMVYEFPGLAQSFERAVFHVESRSFTVSANPAAAE